MFNGYERKIFITWGTGTGKTEASAFHSALFNAGIADFNLIYLSSVIPSGYDIKIKKFKPSIFNFDRGSKLYVAIAKYFQKTRNNFAWSGLSWIREKSKDGYGFFVEAGAESRRELESILKKSLADIGKLYKKKFRMGNKIIGVKCKKDIVCAVAVAVYKIEKF